MGGEQQELKGPDFASGIPIADIADGAMLLGHANGDAVLLARRGENVFAIGNLVHKVSAADRCALDGRAVAAVVAGRLQP